jgi:hypothetical protein
MQRTYSQDHVLCCETGQDKRPAEVFILEDAIIISSLTGLVSGLLSLFAAIIHKIVFPFR